MPQKGPLAGYRANVGAALRAACADERGLAATRVRCFDSSNSLVSAETSRVTVGFAARQHDFSAVEKHFRNMKFNNAAMRKNFSIREM